ncbi:MAG: ABC transporter permease [Candidatus Acidiferrales bacterium]|jgi:lipoprotein-releasing system permease protein
MKFAWFVARRYLRSKHRPAVLRLVTWLATVGVAAGVGTLVVALAMNSGFRHTFQDRLLGVTAHVNLSRPDTEGIEDYRALGERLGQTPGVRSVAPAIYLTVLLVAPGGRPRGVVIKGIDPAIEIASDEALRRLTSGRADFAEDANGFGGIVIGQMLADDLGIAAGDYVTLMSPEGELTPFGQMPRSRRFRVAGIFNSGFYDYDANWGFIALPAAQGLAGVGDVASVLEFRLADPDRAEQVAGELKSEAGPGYLASTWQDENRALFRALHFEKLVTALFIGLITFVAGLNILVVLAMTVSDRARDIAVLTAMGARRRQVRDVFILQGLAIGAFGTFTGLAAGYSLAWAAGTYRLIPLDPQVYSVPYVPFQPNGLDAIWIGVAAVAICLASTVIPARAAMRLTPVEILRYE